MVQSEIHQTAWVEGMLVTPQHFQHQARSNAYHHARSMHYLQPYPWGFKSLAIDQIALEQGKLCVTLAEGIFSNGSLFAINAEHALSRDIDSRAHELIVYLAIPVNDRVSDNKAKNARYHLAEIQLNDQILSPEPQTYPILVQQLNLCLLTSDDVHDNYYTLPIARVKMVSEEKGIILDPSFIPPCLDIAASPVLQQDLTHLIESLERAKTQLSRILVNPIQSQSVAAVTDILLLQLFNRYHVLFTQYQNLPVLHPYLFFQSITTLAAEMHTFLHPQRKLTNKPSYQHHHLGATRTELLPIVFNWLNAPTRHQAARLPLSNPSEGLFLSQTIEPQHLTHTDFILVFSADVAGETLQTQLKSYIKVATPETIDDLIHLQLSGLALIPLSTVPPQLPYRAEAVYFRINQQDEKWASVKTQRSLAIAVSHPYPNLRVELWLMPQTRSEK
ncbi:MAG: type VI secretion system baseplate subunit TssK [Pseudomonadota bacterium]